MHVLIDGFTKFSTSTHMHVVNPMINHPKITVYGTNHPQSWYVMVGLVIWLIQLEIYTRFIPSLIYQSQWFIPNFTIGLSSTQRWCHDG